jgi:hypothetical protein
MKRPREFDGMHWDSEAIRREREYGWFLEHEEELIKKAREKRLEAKRARETEESEKRRLLHWRMCPECGSELHVETIEDVDAAKCAGCEGIFFNRGDLETLLMRHDEHRRGFFRRLLGFHREPG